MQIGHRILSLVGVSFLFACGSSASASSPYAEPEMSDGQPTSVGPSSTPSSTAPRFQPPVLVTSPLRPGMRNDLTDPEADAICAVRFSGSRTGSSNSGYQFDIWDHADVAVTLLGRDQLDVSFGWAGVAAERENQERYLEETRYTISFVPDAPSDFMIGEVAGSVFKTSATRTCDKTGGANDPAMPSRALGAARLRIQKRTVSSIEGVMTLVGLEDEGGTLTFSAPIGPLVPHDDTVCCLENRYLQESPPAPPMNAEEIAAACQARDAAPPVGTFEADPELGLSGYVDVTVDESLHDSVGVAGKHAYSSRFELTFRSAYTKGTKPVTESQSWEGWSVTQESDALIVQPFGVGRHDGLGFSGYSAGSTCGDGFGFGGSGTFGSDMKASLVITTRTDEIVEGSLELSDAPGKISKVHFRTQLHPPPRPSVCCLEQ